MTDTRKPRLSGAARRKLARQAAARENYGVMPRARIVSGELSGVVVGQLDTVSDWRREIGRIFREARAGTLATEDASRLTFIAQVGARVSQVEQELEGIRALHEAVVKVHEGGQPVAWAPPEPASAGVHGPLEGELLPATPADGETAL